MAPESRSAVEAALTSQIASLRAVSGGDINEAYRATLDDGRVVFIKTNRNAPAEMFPSEALGLAWLALAGVLRVPRVLAVSQAGQAPFLALEYLEPAARARGFDELLGRGLAALHRFGAPSFGLGHDNFIGRLPQSNTAARDWPSFYRDQRLVPQVERAARANLLGSEQRSAFERLYERLPDLVGDSEPPARLHGDLWGGNLHVDDVGAPCLIDPAVYGGHREMDLAMMRLFGGFAERVFATYDEAYPLSAGHEQRVDLYQLYPLLVHVNLFGAGYVSSVMRALRRYQ
jgi:fructosamine-3-kinase